MALDEFGKSVEFPQVSEFAEPSETFISSPEFPPLPDEFAYPGTVGTSSDSHKNKTLLKGGLLYYAAAAAVIMAVVTSTNGFTDMSPEPAPDEQIVAPGGAVTPDGNDPQGGGDTEYEPDITADLVYSVPSGAWTDITYDMFFLMKADDPHMMDYDLEVDSFKLNWYDGGEAYIGGGDNVWEPNTRPDMEMLASVTGYMFNYMGPAHTDLAPDEAVYYTVVLTLTDNSTGRQYSVETELEPLQRESGIDFESLFAENREWYNEATGDYLHFGSVGGWKAHWIQESLLFYRFRWEGAGDNKLNLELAYSLGDRGTMSPVYSAKVEEDDQGYVITFLNEDGDQEEYRPVASVGYDGYSYMYDICDLSTVDSLATLRTFSAVFSMGREFDLGGVSFQADGRGKMTFTGNSGASWWQGSANFSYYTLDRSDTLPIIVMNLDNEVRRSANSSVSGEIQARVEYYSDGPMLIVDNLVSDDYSSLLEWGGDATVPGVDSTIEINVTMNGQTAFDSFAAGSDPGLEALNLATETFGSQVKGVRLIRTMRVFSGTQTSDDYLAVGDEDAPDDMYVLRGSRVNIYIVTYYYEAY